MALTDFASRSLPVKVHLKKKSGGRKTRRCSIGNRIPHRTPWSFFFFAVFFRGGLSPANSSYLPPPCSFYGEVTGSSSINIPQYLYRYSGARATCRNLLAKVHPKKKSGGRKTRRLSIGNRIFHRFPSSLSFFFRLWYFLEVNFLKC